jgi:hypothetical protein
LCENRTKKLTKGLPALTLLHQHEKKNAGLDRGDPGAGLVGVTDQPSRNWERIPPPLQINTLTTRENEINKSLVRDLTAQHARAESANLRSSKNQRKYGQFTQNAKLIFLLKSNNIIFKTQRAPYYLPYLIIEIKFKFLTY